MKKGFIFLVVLFTNTLMSAQDNYFAQYNASKTNTNPAFTGTDSTLVLSSATSFQFPIKENYNQLFFSADNYFRRLRGGLGITYSRESIGRGKLITSRLNLTYAPHFEFFNHKLAFQPALSVGYFRKSIDMSKLTFGNMIDERTGFVYNTKEAQNLSSISNIDLSAGILLYTKQFYGGFAVHHLTEPNEGLMGGSKLPALYTLHGGVNLNLGDFTISPNLMYQRQKDFSMLLLGSTVKYKWFMAGIAFGNSKTVVSTMGFQNRFFRISYSYCISDSPDGINEIHFNWYFKHRKVSKVQSIRLI